VEFHEVVRLRRTTRESDTRAVPGEAVRRALEADLRAPCKAHLRSWQFIHLRDRERRRQAVVPALKARSMSDPVEIGRLVARFGDEELKSVYPRSLPVQQAMVLESPKQLVVCFKLKPLPECRTPFELNALASVLTCIESVMLALADEGLFGRTCTPYDASGLQEFLDVPIGYEIAAVIPFGYPKTPPVEAEREDLDARLHVDRW
jgi:nitroreductase